MSGHRFHDIANYTIPMTDVKYCTSGRLEVLPGMQLCPRCGHRAFSSSRPDIPPKRLKEWTQTARWSAIGAGVILAAVVLWRFIVLEDRQSLEHQAQNALVAGDFEQAIPFLERLNTPEAEYALAGLYESGLGVQADRVRAVSLLTRAANAGLPVAQTTLGVWYANGEGVDRDPATAVLWYKEAASHGDTWGAVLLGLAYGSGDGVGQDLEKALTWFTVASSRGDAYATSEQDILDSILGPEQRRAAETEAQEELTREPGGGRD